MSTILDLLVQHEIEQYQTLFPDHDQDELIAIARSDAERIYKTLTDALAIPGMPAEVIRHHDLNRCRHLTHTDARRMVGRQIQTQRYGRTTSGAFERCDA